MCSVGKKVFSGLFIWWLELGLEICGHGRAVIGSCLQGQILTLRILIVSFNVLWSWEKVYIYKYVYIYVYVSSEFFFLRVWFLKMWVKEYIYIICWKFINI